MAQPKLDGWRAQVRVDEHAVRVWSRNGHVLKVPELDCLPEMLGGRSARLDGELVVMAGAVGDFAALSSRMMRGPGRSTARAGFLAFDLLELTGVDLTNRPWIARQEALQGLQLRGCTVGTVPVISDPQEAWARAVAGKWEGITYKRPGSVWRAGERSPHWRKRKVWTRGEVHVTAFRVLAGEVDAIAVRTVDGCRRAVLEHPGSALAERVLAVTSTTPDGSGWRSVQGVVSLRMQYRLGPSGVIREPVLI